MSTFLALRTRCSVRFSDAAFALVTDATWKDHVNTAYRRVQSAEALWPWRELTSTTLTVVAATRSIALPIDAWRVLSVYNSTDTIKLWPFEGTVEQLRQWDQTETGTPIQYRILNDLLQVYPIPTGSTVLTVEYLGRAADLSGDSDLPVFPSQYHDILVEGALADAYADDGNTSQYTLHDGRFKELLAEMRQDLLSDRQERSSEIVDNWF